MKKKNNKYEKIKKLHIIFSSFLDNANPAELTDKRNRVKQPKKITKYENLVKKFSNTFKKFQESKHQQIEYLIMKYPNSLQILDFCVFCEGDNPNYNKFQYQSEFLCKSVDSLMFKNVVTSNNTQVLCANFKTKNYSFVDQQLQMFKKQLISMGDVNKKNFATYVSCFYNVFKTLYKIQETFESDLKKSNFDQQVEKVLNEIINQYSLYTIERKSHGKLRNNKLNSTYKISQRLLNLISQNQNEFIEYSLRNGLRQFLGCYDYDYNMLKIYGICQAMHQRGIFMMRPEMLSDVMFAYDGTILQVNHHKFKLVEFSNEDLVVYCISAFQVTGVKEFSEQFKKEYKERGINLQDSLQLNQFIDEYYPQDKSKRLFSFLND